MILEEIILYFFFYRLPITEISRITLHTEKDIFLVLKEYLEKNRGWLRTELPL